MRYHYRGERKASARLISLSGLYAFNINPVLQVIVDPRQDNLVVNLDQKLLLVIEDHPEFELVLSDKEKEKAKPEAEVKVEAPEEEEEKEELSEEAPKPAKRRGRKPKTTKGDSNKKVLKED